MVAKTPKSHHWIAPLTALLILVGYSPSLASHAATTQDTPAAAQRMAEADLLPLERQLAAALVAKDGAVFDRLLAPDFVLRGAPDVTRSAWIDNALKLCWGDRFDITDFRVVQASPEAAIVALVLTTHLDPASCEPATIRSLLTDVWRREAGGWRLALRHSGPADAALAAQFAKIDPPPPVFEGSAELSLVSAAGNSETESLGLGGTMIWRPGLWTTESQLSFLRSEAFGVETARALVASVRQGRTITPRLDAFGRGEYLVNEFAGIENRITVDGGLGFKAIEGPVHTLRLDGSVGFAHESRLAEPDIDAALANAAGIYRWQFRKNAALDNLSLFTASLDRSEDWRFRNSVALSAVMTRLLSLKLAHELKYVNAPVAGFEKTDRILSAAIVAKFPR